MLRDEKTYWVNLTTKHVVGSASGNTETGTTTDTATGDNSQHNADGDVAATTAGKEVVTLMMTVFVTRGACSGGWEGPGYEPFLQTGRFVGSGLGYVPTLLFTHCLCRSEDTLNAVDPFNRVSMPWEVNDPTHGIGKKLLIERWFNSSKPY